VNCVVADTRSVPWKRPEDEPMPKTILVCGGVFDGLCKERLGPAEILIEGDTIAAIGDSVGRPAGAKVIDLSDRTASPGFIDTHVHLCVDGLDLARQSGSVGAPGQPGATRVCPAWA
jgi:imidazolonepropionase-like amidohydrolase